MNHNKERDHKGSETMVINKGEKSDMGTGKIVTKRNDDHEMIQSLRKSVGEGRERERILREKVDNLEEENHNLKQ